MNTPVCDIDRSTTLSGAAHKIGLFCERAVGATVAFVMCSLFFVIYGHILSGWVDDLKIDPSYVRGLLLPFVSIHLTYRILAGEKGAMVRASVRADWRGAFLVPAGWALLIVGERTTIVFLTQLSFLILPAAIVVSLFGSAIMRALAFPYFLLYLALSLPAPVYSPIVFHLQLLSSAIAGCALDLLGVPALREGKIITLPNVSSRGVQRDTFALCAKPHRRRSPPQNPPNSGDFIRNSLEEIRTSHNIALTIVANSVTESVVQTVTHQPKGTLR